MTNHDRRAQPRVEWTGEAVAAFGAREVRLQTFDLSVGGCSVETPWCPRTGERVGIVLQLDGEPIGAWAEVAWASRRFGAAAESYRWGLRFLELEQTCHARLAAFVDHCLAVDMLDEMLRGARDESPPVPAFGAGELEDIPTRIFHHGQEVLPGRTFFPVEAASAFEGEATAEIDVESTLTSEVPHTRTVQVDLAGLYASTAGAPVETATRTTPSTPPSTAMGLEVAPDPWGPAGPDAIGFDGGWDAPAAGASMGWDDGGVSAPAEFIIEPLAAEPARPTPAAARRPVPSPIADGGDPFWAGATAAFPTRTPDAWPTPPAAPSEPFAGTPAHDPNAYAKAAPFDSPGMEPIALPADDDDFGGFAAAFEHPPVTTTRPAFESPRLAAPAAPAPTFEVGHEEHGFDTHAFAQQPVAPPPFSDDAFAQAQAFAQPQVFAQPQAFAQQAFAQPQAFAPAAFVEPLAADPHAFDPQAFDAHAFDPQAFDPQALAARISARPGPTPTPAGPAPITGPYPVLEPAIAPAPEVAPLSADDLLELKRKRVEALLSSVPRRAEPNKTAPANNAKDDKPAAAKRPKPRPADADTGLKRLFDEALRDIKQGE